MTAIKMIYAALLAALLSLVACATSFTGDAHYPGGASACYQNCQNDNLEMAAFIYSGEFATSCVCKLPPAISTTWC